MPSDGLILFIHSNFDHEFKEDCFSTPAFQPQACPRLVDYILKINGEKAKIKMLSTTFFLFSCWAVVSYRFSSSDCFTEEQAKLPAIAFNFCFLIQQSSWWVFSFYYFRACASTYAFFFSLARWCIYIL